MEKRCEICNTKMEPVKEMVVADTVYQLWFCPACKHTVARTK